MADPIISAGAPGAAVRGVAVRGPLAPLGRPDALRQLLVSRGVPGAADDESLLRAARAPEHKLSVTLLSAWEAAGRELEPAQLAELGDNRRRIDRYRSTWELIGAVAPEARLVKGAMIASRYPDGLIRAAGDLDVICPADQLWLAASALIEQGWQLAAFTLLNARTPEPPRRHSRGGRAPEISIALYQPSDSDIEDPYEVELRTLDVATSMRLPAWRLSGTPMSSIASSVLALVAERWERPFRSRDVYDLAVLSDHLDRADLAGLRAGLTVTGLWPEQRELSGLLRRSGLRPAPELPGARWCALRARAVRLGRMVARWSNPLRLLGYLCVRTVDQDRGALADRIATLTHERIGVWRLLQLGLPMFAVPLPDAPAPHAPASAAPPGSDPPQGPASTDLPQGPANGDLPQGPAGVADPDAGSAVMRLVRHGPHVIAVTPAGSFLMVAGSCQELWLDQATAALGGGQGG
jgi:hypothetical protein